MTLGIVRPDCWDIDSYFVQVPNVQAALDSSLLGRDISVTGHTVDHAQFDKASDMFVATSGACLKNVIIMHITLFMMHDFAERTALVVRFHDIGVSERYLDKSNFQAKLCTVCSTSNVDSITFDYWSQLYPGTAPINARNKAMAASNMSVTGSYPKQNISEPVSLDMFGCICSN